MVREGVSEEVKSKTGSLCRGEQSRGNTFQAEGIICVKALSGASDQSISGIKGVVCLRRCGRRKGEGVR